MRGKLVVLAVSMALSALGVTSAVADDPHPYVGGIGDLTTANCGGQTVPGAPGVGGVCIDIPAGKSYAAVTISDTHGKPSYGEVYFRDATNTSIEGTYAILCGNRTVPIPPGAVKVYVYAPAGVNESQPCGLLAAPPTTGTIDVQFLDSATFVGNTPASVGTGSANMSHVANVSYPVVSGWPWPGGTDVEFVTLDYLGGPHRFAVAGTYQNGMHIIDITNPASPVEVANYDCRIYQADVQIFRRGASTYVAYAVDDYSRTDINSDCFRDINFAGDVRYGTFFIDITNPAAPQAVSFMPFAQGSHNTTIDPSGQYLYSSNADLPGVGTLEVFDLTNILAPTLKTTLSLGASLPAHDVTFSADGSRAYVAALTSSVILDTTDPGNPSVIGTIVDPTINIHHQADPVTLTDPILGTRTFLIVTDELAGAEGNGACPGGGLHVYDITGDLEKTPLKVGFFDLPDTSPATNRTRCTAHVMRIYPDQKLMTIAWYASGVHVLDLSSLIGVSLGSTPTGSLGMGITQTGWFAFGLTDTWSVKAPADGFASDGSFDMFANDQLRGFDVYHYDASAPVATARGRWMSAAQAARALPHRSPAASLSLSCILRPQGRVANVA